MDIIKNTGELDIHRYYEGDIDPTARDIAEDRLVADGLVRYTELGMRFVSENEGHVFEASGTDTVARCRFVKSASGATLGATLAYAHSAHVERYGFPQAHRDPNR